MEQVNTVKTMKYVHNDQLGSINVITDATGAVLERLSFDAFGKPRNPDGTDATPPPVSAQTTRGYTGHKMDAEVGLINMNARLYDPILGRFISADVTIDAPQDMQTYNRYTYVINNPFAHTDPSGNWSWKNFFKEAKNVAVVAAVAAVAIVSYQVVSPYTMGIFGKIIGGALAGAVSGSLAGATSVALSGGNSHQIWDAALKGTASGAIMGGVGGCYGDAWSIERVAAQSIAGGFASKVNGGRFETGFKVALVTSMIRVGFEKMKSITNELKLKSLELSGKDPMDKRWYNRWGELLTDGSRGVRPGTLEMKSILGSVVMAGEGSGEHWLYSENSWIGRFVNWTSKTHDFMNSGGYDWNTGFVANSSSIVYGSAYDVWSFAGMLPAAAYTGVAMTANTGATMTMYDSL